MKRLRFRRCHVCSRLIYRLRPGYLNVRGSLRPFHMGCLRAFVIAGKVSI